MNIFRYLAFNAEAFNITWGICLTISITCLLYYCFQRVDFSKFFKANSTFQIKTILFFISLAISIICAIGFCLLLNTLVNIF